MAYKWKPSKTARREFAQKMQDPAEKAAYENRKVEKANKRRAKSSFDYETAGGNYVPTKEQSDFCLRNMHLFKTAKEQDAANQVMFGYTNKEKVHHDYIHIVNEVRRSNPLGNASGMVTITNYFEQTKGFDFSKITHPKKDAIKQGHDFVKENHDLYNDDTDIKTAIDNHIKLVNEVVNSNEEKQKPSPKAKEHKPKAVKPMPKAVERAKAKAKAVKQRKPKYKEGDRLNWRDNDNHVSEKITEINFKTDGEPVYTVTGSRSNPSWKYSESEITDNIKRKVMYLNQPAPAEVHHIEPEVKFIKRYASLNGKTKSPDDLMPFLSSLQKAITDKTITKTSKYASEIIAIQKGLLKAINAGTVKIEIDEDSLNNYIAIASGQKLIVSVPIIKQFIALQGKEGVKDKAKALRERIAKAELTGLLKGDPHESDVIAAKGIITAYIDGKTKVIHVPDISLRGLYGIIGETMPATEFKTGRIVSSSDFVNANFVLLGFEGKWKKLIGSPQEPFKIMMYGEPGTGTSSLALQLGHYLAKNHNQDVLEVSKEEGFHYTVKEKLDRLMIAHPKLYLTDILPDDLKNYKTVVLDSVNTLGYDAEKLRDIYAKNPKTNFVLVVQTTKDGKFRGGKEIEHDVDCVIRTEAMVAYPEKNRFGGRESIKIA